MISHAAIERERIAETTRRLLAGGVRRGSADWLLLMHKAVASAAGVCLARTRSGNLCDQPGIGAGGRCMRHGGASTGAKTAAGKALSLGGLKQFSGGKAAARRRTPLAKD